MTSFKAGKFYNNELEEGIETTAAQRIGSSSNATIASTPDGKYMLAVEDKENRGGGPSFLNSISLFETDSLRNTAQKTFSGDVLFGDFSTDSKYLVCNDVKIYPEGNRWGGKISIFDISRGTLQEIRSISLPESDDFYGSVFFSSDNPLTVSSVGSRSVKFWDVENPNISGILQYRTQQINDVIINDKNIFARFKILSGGDQYKVKQIPEQFGIGSKTKRNRITGGLSAQLAISSDNKYIYGFERNTVNHSAILYRTDSPDILNRAVLSAVQRPIAHSFFASCSSDSRHLVYIYQESRRNFIKIFEVGAQGNLIEKKTITQSVSMSDRDVIYSSYDPYLFITVQNFQRDSRKYSAVRYWNAEDPENPTVFDKKEYEANHIIGGIGLVKDNRLSVQRGEFNLEGEFVKYHYDILTIPTRPTQALVATPSAGMSASTFFQSPEAKDGLQKEEAANPLIFGV